MRDLQLLTTEMLDTLTNDQLDRHIEVLENAVLNETRDGYLPESQPGDRIELRRCYYVADVLRMRGTHPGTWNLSLVHSGKP